MAMVRKVFEIIDGANNLRDRIHKSAEIKKETKAGELVGWADESAQLLSDLAKKVDELFERLVRLEDEVRKRTRPEMLKRKK